VLIDLNPDGGGVLIVATEEELEDLRETLVQAIYDEDGEGVGQVLTNDAVETLTIRRVEVTDDQ